MTTPIGNRAAGTAVKMAGADARAAALRQTINAILAGGYVSRVEIAAALNKRGISAASMGLSASDMATISTDVDAEPEASDGEDDHVYPLVS